MTPQTAYTAAGDSSSNTFVATEGDIPVAASPPSNEKELQEGDVGTLKEPEEPGSAPIQQSSDVIVEGQETTAADHVPDTLARVELAERSIETEPGSTRTGIDKAEPSRAIEAGARTPLRPTEGGKTTWSSGDVSQSQSEALQEPDEITPEDEPVQTRPTTGGKSVTAYASPHHVEAANDEQMDGQEVNEHAGDLARPVTGGKTVLLAVDPRRFEENSTQMEHCQDDPSSSRPHEDEPIDVDEGDEDEDGNEEQDEEDEDEGEESGDVDLDFDVRKELGKVLSTADFTGSFAFNRTYPNAPNPILHIEGLGTIGLPLGSRDAAAIKAHSSQAPFGMADRTVVDKSVRDTWEIDAAQVTFCDTEKWPNFLKTTVGEVCQTLGVNVAASQPRCDLYKLLLYETGSHFLPHVDTEKQDGMFATIVIVLPSEFTGGAVRVSHAGLAETYDCSSTSLSQTTVLAWYTDVKHEVKPVTSGYRLALSFNLVHTTTSLRPAIGGQSQVIQELRRIVRAWKRKGPGNEVPTKLVYLLTHKYSQANLRGSALKGADAHRVALLDMIARANGFRVGLASVVCHESGYGDDDGGREYRSKWGKCAYEEDDEDVGMAEVESTEMNVENLVDVEGHVINKTLDLNAETEAIPSNLEKIVLSGKVDRQQYEGYMGNGAGSLDRWYRRTVLVIWPPWSNFDITHGSNGFTYACTRLAASSSTQPTAEERELADIAVLRASIDECERVIKSVCKAARLWKDLSLWHRAVKACKADSSIVNLGEENVLGAMKVFGFDAIRDTLETTFQSNPDSVSSLKFLNKLEENQSQCDMMTADVAEWVNLSRTQILKNLKGSHKMESKYLVDISLRVADLAFLERIVLPQVKLMAGPLSLLECATHLHSLSDFSLVDKSRLVYDMLRTAISKTDFYIFLKQDAPLPFSRENQLLSQKRAKTAAGRTIILASVCLDACFGTSNEELIPQIMAKLTDFTNVAAYDAQHRAKEILLPLIASLAPRIKQRGPERPIPDMKKLCDTASGLYMDSLSASPRTLEKTSISALFQTCILGGQSELVLSKFIPRITRLSLDAITIRTIVEELQARRESFDSSGESFSAALVKLVKEYGSLVSVDIPKANTGHKHTHGNATTNANTPVSRVSMQAIFEALDFCARMNVPEACREIVARLLRANSANRERLRDILFLLVPELKSMILKYGHEISAPAYAPIFQNAMVSWVVNVLGQRPTPGSELPSLKRLQGWKCSCKGCQPVREFLLQDSEHTKVLPGIGFILRQHIEKELGKYGSGAATWKTVYPAPQGLSVTKTKTIYEPIRWRAAQSDGVKVLNSISNDAAELQAVLGTGFERVVTALDVEMAVPDTSQALATSEASASTHQQSRSSPADTQPARSSTASKIRGRDGTEVERPAKRRKTLYDDKDVIDLTSD